MERTEQMILEPITWDMFMVLPDEEQEAYLRHVTERFRVTSGLIAQDLFGISQKTLTRYISKKAFDIPKSVGGRIPEAVLQRWKTWSAAPTGDPGDAPHTSGDSADVSETVRGVVEQMRRTYGSVRVTITIEPIG